MIDFKSLPQVAPDYDLTQLLEAGCHFGHQARKWHPSMKEWIYTQKDGVHIFDLAKTAAQLKQAYNLAHDLGKQGKTLVVVGTKRQAREIVAKAATQAQAMYVNSRWLGGLLTNWDQVAKSLKKMLEIEEGLKTDKFKGYTKLERVKLDKQRERLERFFGGIKDLKKKPDCLLVIDPGREKNAVIEAQNVGVPIMAIVDSNTDQRGIDLVVPANDDAAASLELLIGEIMKAYQTGKGAK